MTLALLRTVPSAVVAMDTEGLLTSLNPAAERLLEVTATDVVGRPYTEVFGPSLSDRMIGLFMSVARSGQAGEPKVVRATLPGGRRALLHANVGPLRDKEGALAGVLFVAEDRSTEDASAKEVVEGAATQKHLRGALQRYLGESVAGMVDERPSFVGVGGVRQTITVLHADIRGYTTLSESLEPEQVMSMLMRYHGVAVDALETGGATVSRFIGDAILALWNAPKPQEKHARLALMTALKMQAAARAAGTDAAYGVGVNMGDAIVGNLGSERYMNYTAIGDTVNVAARLQSAAPAGGVICSRATLDAAGAGVSATPLGELTVKGRQVPVEAFSVEGVAWA